MIEDGDGAPHRARHRPALISVLLVITAITAVVGLVALVPGSWVLPEAVAGTVAPVVSILGGATGLLASRWSRRGGRAVAAVLTVLALVPLVLAVPGWVPRATPGAHRLTLLSFNDLGGAGDAQQLSRVAVDHDVDVIGLVECNPRCVKDMTPALERAGYEVRGAAAQEWGAGAYRGTALYARRGVRTGAVTPLRTSSGEISYGAVTTTVASGGLGARLAIVHLANPITGPRTWAEDHVRLAELLGGSSPLVVSGDLNTTSFHGRLLWTLQRTGTTSCAHRLGRLGSPTWGTIKHPSVLEIDHALVRGLGCVAQTTAVVPGSDHRALITTVSAQ